MPGHDCEAPHVQPYAMRLEPQAAVGMEGMTLMDILRGRYRSRIPGMNVTLDHVQRPAWAAWDPCSTVRSRCGFEWPRPRHAVSAAALQAASIARCSVCVPACTWSAPMLTC